uniref:BMERB domain-containing protein n=1 Tax=Dendroctonus ponderosae TaxID=77166 RepID=A0AAR5Q014_DENPD
MLGVFKRRWKPKRTSGSARIASESSQEPDRPRSTHQVHPVLDARHLVGYEKDGDTPPPPPPRCLPLAPNICVEAGRIQFVRQEAEAPPARVTRGLQTDEQEDLARVQTYLEGRIVELELALEAAQKGELRDRQTISKLSKQLSRVSDVIFLG